MASFWDDEKRVELLTTKWREGYSASQIATLLGGCSRNAVIAKIHRLGLSGRGGKQQATNPKRPRAPRVQRAQVAGKIPTPKPKSQSPWRQYVAKNPGADAPSGDPMTGQEKTDRQRAAEVVGTKKMVDLEPNECKFPGANYEQDMKFCGDVRVPGMPYCARCCAIAYRPLVSKAKPRNPARPHQPANRELAET